MIYTFTENPYFSRLDTRASDVIPVYQAPKRVPGYESSSGVDIWYHKRKKVYVLVFWDLDNEGPDIVTVATDISMIFPGLDHTLMVQKNGYLYQRLLRQMHMTILSVSGNIDQ